MRVKCIHRWRLASSWRSLAPVPCGTASSTPTLVAITVLLADLGRLDAPYNVIAAEEQWQGGWRGSGADPRGARKRERSRRTGGRTVTPERPTRARDQALRRLPRGARRQPRDR